MTHHRRQSSGLASQIRALRTRFCGCTAYPTRFLVLDQLQAKKRSSCRLSMALALHPKSRTMLTQSESRPWETPVRASVGAGPRNRTRGKDIHRHQFSTGVCAGLCCRPSQRAIDRPFCVELPRFTGPGRLSWPSLGQGTTGAMQFVRELRVQT